MRYNVDFLVKESKISDKFWDKKAEVFVDRVEIQNLKIEILISKNVSLQWTWQMKLTLNYKQSSGNESFYPFFIVLFCYCCGVSLTSKTHRCFVSCVTLVPPL